MPQSMHGSELNHATRTMAAPKLALSVMAMLKTRVPAGAAEP